MTPTRRAILGSACLFAGLLVTGCARQRRSNLPTYPALSDTDALKVLADRAASVKTLSAPADLTLTRPDGDSVRLDAAIVMAPPDRLRLRAWKFGQAVFDLTLTEEGLWVMTPDDPGRREKVLPASVSAAQFAREWALLTGQFFTAPDLSVRSESNRLLVRRRLEDGRTITCTVDRPTLTPRTYVKRDEAGRPRFTLALSDYQMINGIPWPTRLDARSGDGKIAVRMKEVDLNGELSPTAFRPPRRAEKRP